MSNKIKIPDNAKWINSLAKEYDAAMFGDENWGKMSEDEQLALIGRMALFLGFYEPKIQALRDNNRALARAGNDLLYWLNDLLSEVPEGDEDVPIVMARIRWEDALEHARTILEEPGEPSD